jgi:hypothetical protein
MTDFHLTKSFGATLSVQDYELVRAYAYANNISISEAIRSALSHYLHNPTPPTKLHPTRRECCVTFVIPSNKLRGDFRAFAKAHQLSLTRVIEAAIQHHCPSQEKSNSLT